MKKTLIAVLTSSSLISVHAGLITSQGSVTALTDVSQLNGLVGYAPFQEGPNGTAVPLNLYSSQGMLFKTGSLGTILPGVTQTGTAYQGQYYDSNVFGNQFPGTIAGGGTASGFFALNEGVVSFTTPVTQFGLTAGFNGTQYITAWSTTGALLGQVKWTPSGDAAFVGIDTLGVPIGMLAYGNDDVFNGQAYDIGGPTIMSDDWRWASGVAVPETSTYMAGVLMLLPFGLSMLRILRRNKTA